jgi:putative heme iron utilization protein
MSELISPAISDRICQHMNEDHGDAVTLYAKVFGNTPQAESATMVSIDPQGMNLEVQVATETIPVRVKFDRPLKDAEDAHHTLIDMVKQARSSSK